MIDIHTHILPGMDSGCKTAEETVRILQYMAENGTDTVIVTPHYDRKKQSVEDFIAKRDAAIDTVCEYARKHDVKIPKILPGAEVAFFSGMHGADRMEDLCLGQTGYMLVEMPYPLWGGNTMTELNNLASARGIIPIIAHIERYKHMKLHLAAAAQYQFPVQVDADSVLRFSPFNTLLSCIRRGYVQIVASDCRGDVEHLPNLHKAMEKIEHTCGRGKVTEMKRLWDLMMQNRRNNETM